jgi:hypothetical protein
MVRAGRRDWRWRNALRGRVTRSLRHEEDRQDSREHQPDTHGGRGDCRHAAGKRMDPPIGCRRKNETPSVVPKKGRRRVRLQPGQSGEHIANKPAVQPPNLLRLGESPGAPTPMSQEEAGGWSPRRLVADDSADSRSFDPEPEGPLRHPVVEDALRSRAGLPTAVSGFRTGPLGGARTHGEPSGVVGAGSKAGAVVDIRECLHGVGSIPDRVGQRRSEG